MLLRLGIGLNLMQGAVGASAPAPPSNNPGSVVLRDSTTDEEITSGQILIGGGVYAVIVDPDGLLDVAPTYQWQRSPNGSDWANIPGETLNTYFPVVGDDGDFFRILVSYVDDLGNSENVISSVVGVPANTPGTTGIVGTPEVGQTLTVAYSDPDGFATTPFIQWQYYDDSSSDWVAIAGQNGELYTVTIARLGQLVRATVEYTDTLGNLESLVSDPVGTVTVSDSPGTAGITGGSAEVGSTLIGEVSDADGVISVDSSEWQESANGVSGWTTIAGAFSVNYLVSSARIGKYIRYVAEYTDGLGISSTVTSSAVGPVVDSSSAVVAAIASSLPSSPTYRRAAMADAITLAVGSTNAKYGTSFTTTDLISLLASNAWYWRFEPGLARDLWGNPVLEGSDIAVLVDMLKGVEMRSDHTGRRFTLASVGATSQAADTAIAPVGDSGNWSAIALAKTANPLGDQTILMRGEAATNIRINGGQISHNSNAIGSVAPLTGNNLIRARVNGTSFTGAINGSNSSISITALAAQPYISIGRTGFSFDGGYRSLLYLNTALTDNQMQLAQAFVVAMESMERVICDGDSITFGTSLTVPTSYPSVLSAALGDRFVVSNFGVPSQTYVNMASDFATQIAPLSGNVWQRKTLVAFGGSNDLALDGVSVATLVSRAQAYFALARAAGYTLIACTLLPRSNGDTPASFEASRQEYNTWLRNNPSEYNALADLGADSRIGQPGDEADTTYYLPGSLVHPNAAGAAVIAEIVQAAIASLPAYTPTNRRGYAVTTGDAVVGSTLTAIARDPNGLSTVAYQWQQSANGSTGWTNISGETNSNYVIGALTGQYIRVRATYTDSAGFAEVVDSAATAQVVASVDPVLASIATNLPYVPAAKRSSLKTSIEFADSVDPSSVVIILAGFSWIVSLDPGDGCTYTSWANTTDLADTNGDFIGSWWNWNTRNAPYFNQDDPALQPAFLSGALRIADGKVVTGQPYLSWTQGEKYTVFRTDADPPSVTDRLEAMGSAESSAITSSGTALTNTGALVDGWGINGTTGLRPSKNWTAPLTSYVLHRSTAVAGQRTSQINLEAETTNTTAGTTGFQSWYAVGTSAGSGGNPDYRFMAARQTPLSSGDRTKMMRFLSHYYGLGLY